jgi:hypothetical protein
VDWIRKESWWAVRVGVLWRTPCVAVCCCAGAIALASWREASWRCYVKIFTTLRLATSSSSSTLVRERNPRDRYTRIRHRSPVNRYNITR